MTNVPPITNRQATILLLLYRYRFLNREQIQRFLHHKDKVRTHRWLKDLKDKDYVEWIYDAQDFTAKTKPAVYYLGLNGIRYLRDLDEYPENELRKRYTEAKRKQAFIDRCLLLANCGLNVEAVSNDSLTFSIILPADYADPDNEFNFLEELQPQALFIRHKDGEVTNFLLECFDASLPRYRVKKRIKDYIAFLDEEAWQGETGDTETPIVQLAFASKTDLIYAKRRARYELTELYDDEIPEEIKLRFTTIDQIRAHGFTSKIWEKLKVGTTS